MTILQHVWDKWRSLARSVVELYNIWNTAQFPKDHTPQVRPDFVSAIHLDFLIYFNLYLHKSSTNFRSISNPICLRSSSTISWFGVEAKVSLGWVILLWSSILPFLLNSAGHSGHLTLYWICHNPIWVLSSSLRVVANSHFLHLKMLLTTYIFPLLLPISTSVYVCTLWKSVIN